MATIPGWMYFIVGVFVAGYSAFVNTKTESSMQIFMYLGAFLIFIGIVKMIFSRSGTKRKKAEKMLKKMPKKDLKKANKQLGISICPRCRSKNYYYARFCHMCGYRIK